MSCWMDLLVSNPAVPDDVLEAVADCGDVNVVRDAPIAGRPSSARLAGRLMAAGCSGAEVTSVL